jgi:hypothetical protein
MGDMTSDDHCYSWAHGTRAGATNAHSSDGPSDISGLLLLPPTVATGDMTSDDRCYYWARGIHAVATDAHNSDGPYDIR